MHSPYLLIVVLTISVNGLFSQELHTPVTQKQGWVNLGAGPGSVEKEFGGVFLGSFSYAFHSKVLTARYLSYKSNFVQPADLSANRLDRAYEVGLLYGLMRKKRFGFVSIGLGLGVLDRSSTSSPRLGSSYRTLGIAVETQTFLTLPALGIGVYGYANINAKASLYGVNIAFQMGKLR